MSFVIDSCYHLLLPFSTRPLTTFLAIAIKQTRQQQNLTQKQLGEHMGVQEAQISKIESGKSITYATIVRAFKALGAKTASLDLGTMGRVALW